MTFQDDVREFHTKCGFHIGEFGEVPPLEVRRARARLLREESDELIAELLSDDPGTVLSYGITPVTRAGRLVDVAKVAHEAMDVHYVTSGAAVNFGYDEDPAFTEIHDANMRKAYLADREVGDEHGKARKPADWTPADVGAVLRPAGSGPQTNAEAAARWLAQESRHPRYYGENWRLILNSDANVEHATRQATLRALPGSSTKDYTDAATVIRTYIRSIQ